MSSRPWYRVDEELLATTLQEVKAVQPLLAFANKGDSIAFAGRYEIRSHDSLLDGFDIEVVPSSVDPRGIPQVTETGGRIPRVVDPHHVNAGDGTLCVTLTDWFWYTHPTGLSLAEFLEGPLRSHLAGQALVLADDPWPAGEWDHGNDGQVQFYSEELRTNDLDKLWRLVGAAALGGLRGDWPCPCRSGRRLLACHHKLIEMADRLPKEVLLDAASAIDAKRQGSRRRA